MNEAECCCFSLATPPLTYLDGGRWGASPRMIILQPLSFTARLGSAKSKCLNTKTITTSQGLSFCSWCSFLKRQKSYTLHVYGTQCAINFQSNMMSDGSRSGVFVGICTIYANTSITFDEKSVFYRS